MILQMVKIPKCMSTQHPDNARIPGFAEKDVLKGEDEVYDALFAFSRLKCDEQMWDAEGKEVYSSVVRFLLEEDQDYFDQNKLGEDLRLTLRVPNPKYEKVNRKFCWKFWRISPDLLIQLESSIPTRNHLFSKLSCP